jgi:hypothetical protein
MTILSIRCHILFFTIEILFNLSKVIRHYSKSHVSLMITKLIINKFLVVNDEQKMTIINIQVQLKDRVVVG